MNEKIIKIKNEVSKFYENNKEKVNFVISCVACIFLGYIKGKSDSLDKMTNLNFNFRFKDEVREGLPSKFN